MFEGIKVTAFTGGCVLGLLIARFLLTFWWALVTVPEAADPDWGGLVTYLTMVWLVTLGVVATIFGGGLFLKKLYDVI